MKYRRSYFAGIVIGLWLLVGVTSGFVNLGPSVVETTPVVFKLTGFTAGAESLLDIIAQRGYVDAGKGVGTQAVPTGRLLVLQTMCVTVANAGAAVQSVVVLLRVNPVGAAVINSPVVATVGAGTPAAVAGLQAVNCVSFGQGLELSGANQLGITQTGTATAGNAVVLSGYERAL